MISIHNLKSVHPFPARMAPSIVWDRLPENKPPLRILDPMAGSGTTLTVARSKGHICFGVDRDPLAVMIATVWCSDIDKELLYTRSRQVLERAKQSARSLELCHAFPSNADEETRKYIKYWFDPNSRRQLASLSRHIELIRHDVVKMFLWTAFSRMIITKTAGVSLAKDVSHSRPHKAYSKAPIPPFEMFLKAVERVASGNPFMDDHTPPRANVCCGDSRCLTFRDNYFDLVITSPPYLNAIDYLRGHKLSLVWMRNSVERIREIRATNIGTEVTCHLPCNAHLYEAMGIAGKIQKLTHRQKGFLAKYIVDMNAACSEIARVLKSGGNVIFVIGDSTINGVFISNSKVIKRLSEFHGLRFKSAEVRPIQENRRYLPPPSNRNRGAGGVITARMRNEVILTMFKVGHNN